MFLAGGWQSASLCCTLVARSPRLASSGRGALAAALQSLVLLVGFGVMTWLVRGTDPSPPSEDFGRARRRLGLRRFGWGFGIGAVLAALAMVIAVAAGRATWQEDGEGGVELAGVGARDRRRAAPRRARGGADVQGVPLLALSRAFGRIPAIVGLSLLFGLGHLSNPGVTGLAVANIAIAGVFLGLAFFTPGGLWTATGAHLGWNLALAGLAAPVSGLPLPMPWLDYFAEGPVWFTGGSFGRRRTHRRALPPGRRGGRRTTDHEGGRGMSRAAVIGSGTMGNGIAHVFAQNGWEVMLIDVAEAALTRGLGTIRTNLERQVKKGTISAEVPAQVLGRITTSTALESAAGAGAVVEAATERPDLKFQIFRTLDERCDPGRSWPAIPARSRSRQSRRPPAGRRRSSECIS